jgi:hypothetical protein
LIWRTVGERAVSLPKSCSVELKWPMRGSGRRAAIGCSGRRVSAYCSVMNRLRGSGTLRGTVGTGEPGGAPNCGALMEPVA